VLADVERFGLNEGWDFSLSTHCRAFLEKIDSDEPDEIFMPCRTPTSNVLQMPLIWKNAVKSTMEPTCPCVAKPTGSKCELADMLTPNTLRKAVLGKQKRVHLFLALLLCLINAGMVPQQSTMMVFEPSRSRHESKAPRMQWSIS